jgi:hypothetical protein
VCSGHASCLGPQLMQPGADFLLVILRETLPPSRVPCTLSQSAQAQSPAESLLLTQPETAGSPHCKGLLSGTPQASEDSARGLVLCGPQAEGLAAAWRHVARGQESTSAGDLQSTAKAGVRPRCSRPSPPPDATRDWHRQRSTGTVCWSCRRQRPGADAGLDSAVQ